MGIELITGKTQSAHVTSADDGALNAGIVGTGRYVLPVGNMLKCELISPNLIRVKDGYALDQGRLVGIRNNNYENITIENGISGTKRNDLLVIRYSMSADTGLETATLEIIKGVSGDTAKDPETTVGDILSGAIEDVFPLYRICLSGIYVSKVERLFEYSKSTEEVSRELKEGLKNASKELSDMPVNGFPSESYFKSTGTGYAKVGQFYSSGENSEAAYLSARDSTKREIVAFRIYGNNKMNFVKNDGSGCPIPFTQSGTASKDNASGQTVFNVTFPKKYTSAPVVCASSNSLSTNIGIANITEMGCTIIANSSNSIGHLYVYWIAVGNQLAQEVI